MVVVFVRKALTQREAEIEELVKSLLSEGIDSETAECLVAFVPMAFAYVILGGLGVALPDGFSVQDPATGRSAHGKLRDEPIFLAACERARAMLSQGPDVQRSAREIAAGSAEWNVIAQLTRDGSDPSDCGLTEAVLMRLPPDYLTKEKVSRQSWWKFWGRPG